MSFDVLYHHAGLTYIHGHSAEVVPQLIGKGVSVVLTDPPHWWRHGWRQREGGMEPFDREKQLVWQRETETIHAAWLATIATVLGPNGSAWIFSHPIYVPAIAAVVHGFPRTHQIRWPWQRLWMREDDAALILIGARGIVEGPADEVGRIFRAAPYCPPYQPDDVLDAILRQTTPEDIILDPFAGSGSFLLAARRAGRRAIGIEMDRDLAHGAAERLRESEGEA